MNFTKFQNLTVDNLYLRTISEQDRPFISDLFSDFNIRKYYIVPKEAQQDYKRLVSYWLEDIANEAGYAWIIFKKETGFFAKDKPIGFITFEYRDNLQNARISYAIKAEFRKLGYITKVAECVIDTLKSFGVESIEADIDEDNTASQRVVEKLGFLANKKMALIDQEMMRDGDMRIRHLWKKAINALKINRYGLNSSQQELIAGINQIIDYIKSEGQKPKFMTKYFYLLGRIKLNEGNYEEASEAFGNCNKILMGEGLAPNHETYYWFAKMREMNGKPADAKMYYGFALENFTKNPELVTKEEISNALNKLK